jgi:hypothetical protein
MYRALEMESGGTPGSKGGGSSSKEQAGSELKMLKALVSENDALEGVLHVFD